MGKRDYFFEIGRVALVNFGPDAGKFVVIVDIVDSNRALVDGPTSDVARQSMPLRWLSLTNIKVPIQRSINSVKLARVLDEVKVCIFVYHTTINYI